MARESSSGDTDSTREARPASSLPARLALQTGQLDDHRACITPDDGFWSTACRLFRERDLIPDDADRAAEVEALWPRLPNRPAHVEALAVTVALAEPYAPLQRILDALAKPATPADALERELAGAPALASPWSPPRPRFPYIYDADSEQRAPIIALLDGPRSPRVAELLNTIKQQDENLSAAIVLGADLDMLDLLDGIGHDARGAARATLADKVESDKQHWMRRADGARMRQSLEGAHYGWRSDNLPPGCLRAARGEIDRNVHDMLRHHAEPAG